MSFAIMWCPLNAHSVCVCVCVCVLFEPCLRLFSLAVHGAIPSGRIGRKNRCERWRDEESRWTEWRTDLGDVLFVDDFRHRSFLNRKPVRRVMTLRRSILLVLETCHSKFLTLSCIVKHVHDVCDVSSSSFAPFFKLVLGSWACSSLRGCGRTTRLKHAESIWESKPSKQDLPWFAIL